MIESLDPHAPLNFVGVAVDFHDDLGLATDSNAYLFFAPPGGRWVFLISAPTPADLQILTNVLADRLASWVRPTPGRGTGLNGVCAISTPGGAGRRAPGGKNEVTPAQQKTFHVDTLAGRVFRLGDPMKSAERALETAAARSWWLRAPRRKRIMGAGVLIVESSLLLGVAGLLVGEVSSWIIAGCMWVSSVAFFIGLATNPVRTARVSVRALFALLVLGVLGWIALVVAVFLAR